jgi:hypothetical protein
VRIPDFFKERFSHNPTPYHQIYSM